MADELRLLLLCLACSLALGWLAAEVHLQQPKIAMLLFAAAAIRRCWGRPQMMELRSSFFIILATVLAIRLSRRPNRKYWLAYVFAMFSAILVHPFAYFSAVSHLLWFNSWYKPQRCLWQLPLAVLLSSAFFAVQLTEPFAPQPVMHWVAALLLLPMCVLAHAGWTSGGLRLSRRVLLASSIGMPALAALASVICFGQARFGDVWFFTLPTLSLLAAEGVSSRRSPVLRSDQRLA